MTLHNFLQLIGRKKQTIFSIFVLFFLIAGLVTAIQPFKYGSTVQLLTVRNFNENTDPYAASKSSEYLSSLLAKIISSNSFFEKVKTSDFNIDTNYFNGTESKQIKKWNNTVKARSLADTGIIILDAYHTDRNQAEQIARATTYILQTNHTLYHGFGSNVQIKVIDAPLTSNYPVKPNVVLTLSLVFIFTIIFSLIYIYILPEERYDIRFWPKRQKSIDANYQDFNDDEVEDNWESVASIINNKDFLKKAEQNDSIDSFEGRGSMENIKR